MRTNGFTLKELLTVVAIIALLLAILLPVMISARRSADLAPCMTHLRQVHIGLAGYREDYSGEWPTLVQLAHYGNTKAVLKCPSDKYEGANRRESRRAGIPISYFYPPGMRDYFTDLASVDSNHGVMVCVLHGEVRNSELLETDHFNAILAFTGRVLRLCLDGSIQTVQVPIRCWQDASGTPSETRCPWDLFTDASSPDLRAKWCPGETGTEIPCK